MYESFEDAKMAAMDVVERIYGGDKMDCVIVERRTRKGTQYMFRFYGSDTNGEFVPVSPGEEERRTRI